MDLKSNVSKRNMVLIFSQLSLDLITQGEVAIVEKKWISLRLAHHFRIASQPANDPPMPSFTMRSRSEAGAHPSSCLVRLESNTAF